MDTAAPNDSASADVVLPEPEDTTVVVGPQGRKTHHKSADIRPYDFRQPTFLAPTELRKLKQLHEEFVRSLAARLSMYLRLEVTLQMSKLQTVCYQNFTENLSTPAHVALFKAEPLKGICLLDIPPRLGLTIVDRLLGGTATSQPTNRDLTEIEAALLDQAVTIVLNEWCHYWRPFEDLRPTLLGHESNGKFLQTAPHDTVMVCIAIEVGVGDCVEQMQLAFPHYTLEPIVKQLTALSIAEKQSATAKPVIATCWNRELDDVPVRVAAEWSGLQLTARELVSLQPGDVLMLDPHVTDTVQVNVSSTPKYSGRLGTRGAKWAVELTQPLTN
ncbi:MAG TPA: FliM/FliN family flagellar motor switch protein [Candidatus Acidoferrum sp.]|nr:FliM/FliN family flagellar motor switch protein [Candidatus Acidoferrum sp.]